MADSEVKPPPYSAVPPSGHSITVPPQAVPVSPAMTSPPMRTYRTSRGPIYMTHPSYGATSVITVQPIPAAQVIVVGGCPACRIGILEDDFTLLGLLCAILFFPIGILCCLALRQKRCTNCGAIFH
ncbi:membrane protein BRI3-like [Artemia franciscana]|uniref:Membrane protein BRI3 n=1 Tax=Artemia franciscana TaxID=6661 RepID=A0AA88L079_ARTSF|nr:hypothetical protein QYM36_008651 [Artemia franciscana]